MAQMKAGFITGANAKIKIGSTTLAYCTDVSYNIIVDTIPIESMGKYEVHSNEPVGYRVDGTLSVIRYTARASSVNSKITDAAENGNAPQRITSTTNTNLQDHINPAKMLLAETFDLDIIEKATEASAAGQNQVFRVSDCRLTRRGSTLNKRGVLVDQYAYVGILASDQDLAAETDKVGISRMTGGKDLTA